MPFARVDLSALARPSRLRRSRARAAELQASLDLAGGPLLRGRAAANWGRSGRAGSADHSHLAVDGVSWRILLEDLQTAYRQLSRGEASRCRRRPPRSAAWAEHLAEYACRRAPRHERGYWLAAPARSPHAAGGRHARERWRETEIVEVSLTAEETRALLQEVPEVYRTQINDVLLTGAGPGLRALDRDAALRLDLEGHGREEIGAELD